MKRPGGFDGGAPEPPERPSEGERTAEEAHARPPVRLTQWRRGAPPVERPAAREHVQPPDGDSGLGETGTGESGLGGGDIAEHPTVEITPIGLPVRGEASAAISTLSGGEGAVESAIEGAGDTAEEDPVREAARALKRASRAVRRRERREQRRFTSHKRRRRRNWAIAGIAVAALAVFVAVGVLSPLMAVRDVEIRGASLVNVDDLSAALSRFEGVPLALVDESDVHAALEPFPLVERYAIERVPPHTLVVRIEERLAVIAIEGDGTYTLIDAAGVVVGSEPEPPVGVPVGSGAVIDVATPAFQAASHAVRDLPQELRAQIALVTASSAQDVTMTTTSGTEIVWGEASEAHLKSLVLQAMLSTLGQVSLIDVSTPGTPVFRQ